MDRILLHFNKVEADRKNSILAVTKNQLQTICDEFASLNPSFSINLEEVSSLFGEVTNPQAQMPTPDIEQIKNLIFTKLFPEGKINGLPVNIEKVEELYQLPNIDSLLKKIRSTHILAIEFLNSGFYKLDKAGKIVIVPGAEEQINESFKIYADSDEEFERLEKAKALANALNDIRRLAVNEFNFWADIEMVVDMDEMCQFIPNPDFVKAGRVGQYLKGYELLQVINPNQVTQTKAPTPNQGSDFSDEFLKQMGLGGPQE
jgi:hypothetical protein